MRASPPTRGTGAFAAHGRGGKQKTPLLSRREKEGARLLCEGCFCRSTIRERGGTGNRPLSHFLAFEGWDREPSPVPLFVGGKNTPRTFARGVPRQGFRCAGSARQKLRFLALERWDGEPSPVPPWQENAGRIVGQGTVPCPTGKKGRAWFARDAFVGWRSGRRVGRGTVPCPTDFRPRGAASRISLCRVREVKSCVSLPLRGGTGNRPLSHLSHLCNS